MTLGPAAPATEGQSLLSEARPEVEPGARRHHATYLAIMLAVLALSFVLKNQPASPGSREGTVSLPLPGDRHWTLPPACPVKAMTGHDCPGCGLTRSFVAIAHGDLDASLLYNRMGIAFFIAVLYQLLYRPWMIARGETLPPRRLLRVHELVCYALIAGLFVNWIYNIVRHVA